MYDGEILAHSTRGDGKQWVAVVRGTHDEYDLEREFVAYAPQMGYDTGNERVHAGDLIEHRTHAESHHPQTEYYIVRRTELQRIPEDVFFDIVEDQRNDRLQQVNDNGDDTDYGTPEKVIEGIEVYGVRDAPDADHYDEHLIVRHDGVTEQIPVTNITHPEFDEPWDATQVYVWFSTVAQKILDDDTAYGVVAGDRNITYRSEMNPELNPELVLWERDDEDKTN